MVEKGKEKEKELNVVRVSSCLPTAIYNQLVEVLKSPFSLAEDGKLDKGAFSAWLRDCASSTIVGKGKADIMEQFINYKGLTAEFKEFYAANSSISLEDLL